MHRQWKLQHLLYSWVGYAPVCDYISQGLMV